MKQAKDGQHRTILGKDTALTKRNIMAAILQTKGPVSNHKVLVCSWKFLRLLTAKQYQQSCQELEAVNIGAMVTIPNGCRSSQLFFKKPPDEALPGLASLKDLCPADYYAERFYLPIAKAMGKGLRDRLATMGLT